jgi:hypothetical protein
MPRHRVEMGQHKLSLIVAKNFEARDKARSLSVRSFPTTQCRILGREGQSTCLSYWDVVRAKFLRAQFCVLSMRREFEVCNIISLKSSNINVTKGRTVISLILAANNSTIPYLVPDLLSS